MNDRELAYIAGIIDGEGTISLQRSHDYKYYAPIVSVSNTHLGLIEWLKKKAGGFVVKRHTKRKPSHSQAYVWNLRTAKALQLPEMIKYHLIVKRAHAELILTKYKKLTPRNGRYTETQLKEKMELVAEIRKLNRRS